MPETGWICRCIALLALAAGSAAAQTTQSLDTVAGCKEALAHADPRQGVDCRLRGTASSGSGIIAGTSTRFFLEDGTGGVLARARRAISTGPVARGERLEISGEFYLASDKEYEFRVTEMVRLGEGEEPRPRDVSPFEAQTGCCPQGLIRTRGALRDVVAGDERIVFLIGDELLRAYWLPGSEGKSWPEVEGLERGALIEVTGLNRPHDDGSEHTRYQVRLRAADDMMVLRPPPMLSREEVRALTALALMIALGAGAWIYFLRRTVSRKTSEVEDLVERLEETVAQRTSALEETNRRLESARDEAEAGSRAKSEFLANISHEVRSPLHLVMGHAELLLDNEELLPDQRRRIRSVLDASEGLVRIVDDILDFSKIQAEGLELESIVFDPAVSVRRTVDAFREQARAQGIQLECIVEPGVPTEALGDPTRLGQIFVNLLNNAVRFTEQGSVLVHMDAAASKDGGWELQCSVEDTGIGIPAERLGRVFESFTQADSSTTRKYGGTGLGLAICKGLVEAMGGTISIASELGAGTRVDFSVQIGTPEGQTRTTVSGPITPQGSKGLILVVDDMAELREMLGEMLTRGGYQAAFAATGREAVEQWRTLSPDLILMDIQMPEMGGMEATRAIRRSEGRDGHTPVVALTANAGAEQQAEYLEAGMDDCVTKPIASIDFLYATLEKQLTNTRSRRVIY